MEINLKWSTIMIQGVSSSTPFNQSRLFLFPSFQYSHFFFYYITLILLFSRFSIFSTVPHFIFISSLLNITFLPRIYFSFQTFIFLFFISFLFSYLLLLLNSSFSSSIIFRSLSLNLVFSIFFFPLSPAWLCVRCWDPCAIGCTPSRTK